MLVIARTVYNALVSDFPISTSVIMDNLVMRAEEVSRISHLLLLMHVYVWDLTTVGWVVCHGLSALKLVQGF